MMQSSRNFNPEDRDLQLISTKQIVQHKEEDGEVIYYLPCYVRFLVKQIKGVDVQTMEGTVTGTLLFSFYYGNIDKKLIDEFAGNQKDKEASILLEFNQEDSLLLNVDKGITKKQDEKEKIINFIIRQSFKTSLLGNVAWTPFEILDMYISVTIQTIHLPKVEGRPKMSFKFNCMKNNEVEVLSHGQNMEFGYYRIANYYMEANYTNSRAFPFKQISYCCQSTCCSKKDEPAEQSNAFKCYQYAHFRIPIYKYPMISILLVFIPIWILGLIGLMVFFQESGLGGRLGTIATLSLAFVAFLPTINDSIPRSPNVKMVDILILMELAALILLIIQSFNNRLTNSNEFDWQKSNLYLAAVALNVTTCLIVFFLFILHKFVWEAKYTKIKETFGKIPKTIKRQSWENPDCDTEFIKLLKQSKRLKIKVKNL